MQWISLISQVLFPTSIIFLIICLELSRRTNKCGINRIELSIETMNERLRLLQNSLSHLEGRVQGHFEARSVKQIESSPNTEIKRRRRRSKPSSENIST